MEASLNQGKSRNDRKSSRFPISNQNPCTETLVTSVGEVLGPGSEDFIAILLNELPCFSQARRSQTVVYGHLQGIQPKLGFSIRVMHVYVRSSFLSREEVEPKPAHPQNSRTHISILVEKDPRVIRRLSSRCESRTT